MRRSLPTRRFAATAGAVFVALALALGGGAPASAAATARDQWGGTTGDAGNTWTNAGEHVLTTANAAKLSPTWTSNSVVGGPYAPVVLNGVTYGVTRAVTSSFVASSPKSGAVLWSIPMPGSSANYGYGMAGSGTTVLVAEGANEVGERGEVIAVSTVTHKILWAAPLPVPSAVAKGNGDDGSYPGVPTTDGTRVYVAGSGNVVNAYSLATGALLWTIPTTYRSDGAVNVVDGFAAGGGYLYLGGDIGGSAKGLVVYNASTGKQVWSSSSAAAFGAPVLAGGRVFVTTLTGVAAYPADGCGKATCGPTWTTLVAAAEPGEIVVSAADSSSVYVTADTELAAKPSCGRQVTDTYTRLSASSGNRQWSVNAGGDAEIALVHAGGVVWIADEYWGATATSSCGESDRILGYSDAATTAKPLVTLPVGHDYGFPQSLAVSSGTIFENVDQGLLIGYRIPNS